MAGLGLDQAGVSVDTQSRKIVVDQYDASVSMPHIFAIGDVAMVSHHVCTTCVAMVMGMVISFEHRVKNGT